jgi:ABC-2 type transport system permease protein
MPHWLKYLSGVNPLSYEVDALRGLLVGTQDHLGTDFLALVVAVVVAVAAASSLVDRLAR